MAGYRRVNYYELCRLCTSSEGTKMHIFREEGRRRQLPTKIQICLPLQVCEDDSLPKIICSQCVEKLESFYDFRESCINAEAMLESYFTSLRYSEDFTREGKVYVKEECPSKKKGSDSDGSGGGKPPLPQQQQKVAIATAADGLNSLVQAAGIQIVSDAEGTRVQQYKCAMQMQPGAAGTTVVEAAASEARYSYEPCAASGTPRPLEESAAAAQAVVISKVEDGSTQCSETDFNNKQSPGSSDGSEAVVGQQPQQTVAFATAAGTGQEMLVHFNFTKDRDGFLRADDTAATLQRVDIPAAQVSSMAQIGEFLRMKTVSITDGTLPTAVVEVAGTIARPCDECGKLFATAEELESHVPCSQKGGAAGDDKNGGSFACEICGKLFKRKEHLFQHRKLHTGERPYVCGVCSKAFSRKEHLVRHAVSHTGQKMHACDMCGKAFSRKDNLHKHRKTHGVAGPYVCETCGKSFVVKHYFLMHRGTHAGGGGGEDGTGLKVEEGAEVVDPLPYKCDQCDKAFAAKQYLANHKMRHRGKQAAQQAAQQVAQQQQQEEQQQQQVVLPHAGAPPLTTINNAALLAPNILHQVQTTSANNTTAAMIQVSTSSAGGTTYLCAPTTVSASELIETYRRLHSA